MASNAEPGSLGLTMSLGTVSTASVGTGDCFLGEVLFGLPFLGDFEGDRGLSVDRCIVAGRGVSIMVSTQAPITTGVLGFNMDCSVGIGVASMSSACSSCEDAGASFEA